VISMRDEFLFQIKKGSLMNLHELEIEMNDILAHRVRRDFKGLDHLMIEIYDKRQRSPESNPPLRSLGKMPIDVAIKKFR